MRSRLLLRTNYREKASDKMQNFVSGFVFCERKKKRDKTDKGFFILVNFMI